MGMIAELLFSLVRKHPRNAADRRSEFIFYKIVDSINDVEYMLQCINTKATFQSSITDIVFDIDILHGLHPIQACYIGIEYAKILKQSNDSTEVTKNPSEKFVKYPTSRYGSYSICYQKRKGELCFINKKTKEEILMDPRDIALSEELIQEFDAVQSFYIGLLAGLKLHNPIKYDKALPYPRTHLRLVE